MPIQNLVNATLSEESYARVLELLAGIKAELPFLITLEPEQKQGLNKAANGRAPLVEKGYAVLSGHAAVFPPFLSVENFTRRRALVQKLTPIRTLVAEIDRSLNDTIVAAQSDNLNTVLDAYESLKQLKQKVPGLTVAYDELSAFFPRGSHKSKDDGNPETNPDPKVETKA